MAWRLIIVCMAINSPRSSPSNRAAGTVVARLARRAADATLRATVALSVSTRTGRSTIMYAARACPGIAACHSGHHLPPPSPPRPARPPHTLRAPLQAPCPWRGKPAAVAVPRKRAPAAFLAQPLLQHLHWWTPRPADWWTPNLNPCPATSTAATASFIQNKLRNLHHTYHPLKMNYGNLASTSTLRSCFLSLQKDSFTKGSTVFNATWAGSVILDATEKARKTRIVTHYMFYSCIRQF